MFVHNVMRWQLINVPNYYQTIQRMWNIKARVVPIVIGALGATSNNLEKHLQEIPGRNKIPNW